MKMTRAKVLATRLERSVTLCRESRLMASLRDRTIRRVSFTASDLRLTLDNGRTFIFSAVECEIDHKPTIDFELFPPLGELKQGA